MTLCSVIVLTHNTCNLTLRCLQEFTEDALLAGWQVLLVDNASTDGTITEVVAQFPQVEIIATEQNLGFAGGNNLGLTHARGEFVFLLNSDVLVRQAVLAYLASYLASNPAVAAISPRLLTADGQPQAFAFGGDPSILYLLQRGGHQLLGLGPLHDWAIDHPITADWVSGACLGVRRTTIEQVGPLDANYFLYFEDNDWCLRMRAAGWQIVYNPTVSAVHLGGQSQPRQATANAHYRKSLRRFYDKHYGVLKRTLLDAALWGYAQIFQLRSAFRGDRRGAL